MMIIKRNVELLVHQINNLRVGFLQVLCSEKNFKEEGAKEDKFVDAINDIDIISNDI